MSRKPPANETETAILLRMSASREALLAANSAPSLTAPVRPQSQRHAASTLIASLAAAPRVALVLALCVGAVVLGPRRAIGIAGRSGITAWLAGTVRNVVLKTV